MVYLHGGRRCDDDRSVHRLVGNEDRSWSYTAVAISSSHVPANRQAILVDSRLFFFDMMRLLNEPNKIESVAVQSYSCAFESLFSVRDADDSELVRNPEHPFDPCGFE